MEQAVVVGNCQAPALELMLMTNEEFAKRFEFVSFPPVHELPDRMVPELHDAVAKAALVIPQRVAEGYRDGLGLGTETLSKMAGDATVVRWPSVYWAGYFPDLFYMRDGEGQPITDGPFDYHDRLILEAYSQGLDIKQTCQMLEDPELPSNAQAWAADATAELDIRGQDCDVNVAPYIASGFRDDLLFFTMNHPANRLLGFVAQKIIELLGIKGKVDDRQVPDEILGSTFYPLHANHVRALNLSFGTKFGAGHTQFKIRGVTYNPQGAVRLFFDYYAAHPEQVAANLESPAAQPDLALSHDNSPRRVAPSLTTRARILGRRLRRHGWLRLPEDRLSDSIVKPVGYLSIYEQLLAPLRRRAFTLLELGVWSGHSLEMWRDAFPRATVVGVDLKPPDVHLGPRVHIVRGDQTDAPLMRRLREGHAPAGFDVIIDDASHIGAIAARSLQALYTEHLRPGGLYCIEDWGTGYLPDWCDGDPIASPLDIDHLADQTPSEKDDAPTINAMSSHDAGMVGVIKRLVDHTASGTLRFAQPDSVGNVLAIESITVWDGVVAIRKAKN